MKSVIKLLRPRHWLKNGLIMVPLLFSGRMFEPGLLGASVLGIVAFSLMASVIYVINDIRDVEKDKLHPTKCQRPIASGAVSVGQGYVISLVVFIGAVIINFFACGSSIGGYICFFIYFVLNLGYSFGLKDIPILDIVILASGFLVRVLYGSFITDIDISHWLYLTVLAMSFYLGLGKRRNELMRSKDETRNVLKYYSYNFLDKTMYMFMALAIVFYALWSVDPSTVQRMSNEATVWTVPLVMIICMKYSLNVERDSDGDPISVVLQDKILIGLVALYVVVIAGLIYLI